MQKDFKLVKFVNTHEVLKIPLTPGLFKMLAVAVITVIITMCFVLQNVEILFSE